MIASFNKEIEDEDTQPSHPDQDLETPKDNLLDLSMVKTMLKINLIKCDKHMRHIETVTHHLETLTPILSCCSS